MRKYVVPLLLLSQMSVPSARAEPPADLEACLARKSGKMREMACFPDLGWTVTAATLRGPKIEVPGQGSSLANHGLYVVIELQVEGLKGGQVVKRPTLLDSTGEEYAPLFDKRADRLLSRGGARHITRVGKVAAGQAVSAYLLYDVDGTASGLRLRIPAQDGKGSKLVTLELTI